MQRFKLVCKPFPAELRDVYGFIVANGGRYLIWIDSNQDARTQDRALRHELAHLVLGHLDKTKPLIEIDPHNVEFGEGWEEREQEADSFAERMTDAELAELMQYAT